MTYLIYLLFMLSGFIGLIYEGVWARYLKLFLGHSSYGQILTLSIFMGGLGLGAFLAARYVKRQRNPFYVYAAIELLIGLGALVYHWVYVLLTEAVYSSSLIPALPNFLINTLKVLLSLVVTGPLAVLIGMTFPTIAMGLMRLTRDAGKASLPLLYFTNSLGAAAGIMVTSYVLIPRSGLPGTLLLAGAGNIILAIASYLVAGRVDSRLHLEASAKAFTATMDSGSDPVGISLKPIIYIWLAVSFLTGMSSFLYEIGWIRLLSLLLGSSTHSFDIMVSAFILGLAGGAYFANGLLKRTTRIVLLMAGVQILMGSFALMSIYAYKPFFLLMASWEDVFCRTIPAYYVFSAFKYALCLCMMCPASFCAGTTLPVITYYLANRTRDEKYTGTIYGWNTVGSIVGAATGGLLLLPLLQLKFTIATGAFLDIAAGVFLLSYFRAKRLVLAAACGFSLAVIAPVFLMRFEPYIVASGTFRGHFDIELENRNLTTVRDGRTATVSVDEYPEYMAIRTNGKPDGSVALTKKGRCESDRATQAALAFLPMSAMTEPYRAAIIGFGTGMTAHHLLSDEFLEHLDIVEIEEEMYKLAMKFRPQNSRAYDDPRVKIYFQDAKTYFYSAHSEYDLIISEPSNPWVSGVANLFTVEFYTHLRRFLSEDGVLVQWMHLYEFDNDLLLSILKSIDLVFPHLSIYTVPGAEDDVIIMASQRPFSLKGAGRLTSSAAIAKELAHLGTKPEFFGSQNYLVASPSLRPLLRHSNPNSVYFPIVDSGAERAFYLAKKADLLSPFTIGFPPPQILFEGDRFPPMLDEICTFRLRTRRTSEKEATWEMLLKSATEVADQWRIEVQFHMLVVDAGLYKDWKKDKIVDLYRQYVKDEVPEPPVRRKFELLESVAEGDAQGVAKAIRRVIDEVPLGRVSALMARVLAVNALRYGDEGLAREVVGRYVAAGKLMSSYEKLLFYEAFETRFGQF